MYENADSICSVLHIKDRGLRKKGALQLSAYQEANDSKVLGIGPSCLKYWANIFPKIITNTKINLLYFVTFDHFFLTILTPYLLKEIKTV